jgi:predicted nucleic acid-binding protein
VRLSLDGLLLMPVLQFEQQSALHQFVQNAKGNNYDLTDLLIAHLAQEQGCDIVLTFDKNASKYKLFDIAR